MARKKSSRKQPVPPKEFASSPFKDLKGLSALAEQQSPVLKESTKTTAVKPKEQPVDDQHNFADEMDFLGVKPLSGSVIEEPEPVAGDEVKVSQPTEPPQDVSDQAVFLDAVGAMEKTFKDEWLEDVPSKQAVPRRMKQVERGQLKPEAELDLHGLTIAEASVKVRFFLQDAIYQGFRTVLVIAGKGLHSNDGPVLRQAMETLLTQQRELVVEWGLAPRRYGGDGALVVFLRQPDGK